MRLKADVVGPLFWSGPLTTLSVGSEHQLVGTTTDA